MPLLIALPDLECPLLPAPQSNISTLPFPGKLSASKEPSEISTLCGSHLSPACDPNALASLFRSIFILHPIENDSQPWPWVPPYAGHAWPLSGQSKLSPAGFLIQCFPSYLQFPAISRCPNKVLKNVSWVILPSPVQTLQVASKRIRIKSEFLSLLGLPAFSNTWFRSGPPNSAYLYCNHAGLLLCLGRANLTPALRHLHLQFICLECSPPESTHN